MTKIFEKDRPFSKFSNVYGDITHLSMGFEEVLPGFVCQKINKIV